jgi:hypothetical protein
MGKSKMSLRPAALGLAHFPDVNHKNPKPPAEDEHLFVGA